MKELRLIGLSLAEAARRLVQSAPARGDYFGISMRARYATTREADVEAQYLRVVLERTLAYGNRIPREMCERLKCASCGATGCKLWREYNTFASCTKILCGPCACLDQKKDPVKLGDDGRITDDLGYHCDQIGWMVPAVPTHDGTFWGYTSVPAEGVAWWQSLPLRGECHA